GETTAEAPLRWLGAFVLSAGHRLIFFPGFDFIPDWIRSLRGRSLEAQRQFRVDHVSLERDRRSWHFTMRKSKKQQGGGRTTDLGDGRVAWFGMSVAGEAVLRELRRQTVVSFFSPASD